MGCENWPNTEEYSECVICGEPTSFFNSADAIEEDVARKLVLDIKFAEYYEQHCEKLGITADGPLAPVH